jgi:hypothetical protein
VTLSRRRAAWILAALTAVGAAFRFYNLAWGAPYYHFHIDEHFVLGPADAMHRSMREAVMWPKFFMYSPLLMYLVKILRTAYEGLGHPLNLSVPGDAIIYTVLGRSISAAFGTATIPLVYVIAQRIAGRLAGLLAAALLACSVIHLRDSHFASTDVSLTFACTLALLAAIHVAERLGAPCCSSTRAHSCWASSASRTCSRPGAPPRSGRWAHGCGGRRVGRFRSWLAWPRSCCWIRSSSSTGTSSSRT